MNTKIQGKVSADSLGGIDALEAAQQLHRTGDREAAIKKYEEILAEQPGHIGALVSLGLAFYELGNISEAITQYEHALRLRFDCVEALVNLGSALATLGSLEQARDKAKKAMRINPQCAEAQMLLASILRYQGQDKEAIARFETALNFHPHHAATILSNIGAIYYDQGMLEESSAFFERSLQEDPNYANASWCQAQLYLTLGHYEKGWALYEKGLGDAHLRGTGLFPSKMWDGAPARRKRLLIWTEQGLGDSIQFVRYAALCKERVGKVFVLCQKPLVRLFEQCPYIDKVFSASEECEFDEHIAMLSLPHVFGTTWETVPAKIPYLFVSPEAREKWALKFFGEPEGFRVGLVWAGNAGKQSITTKLRDQQRSISLKKLAPLLQIDKARFYSLQMDAAARQIDQFNLRAKITDFSSDIADFMDTAALIQNLDLVITVDTSVAHLAGALGKPVWILSRYNACWRWPRGRGSSPWYPTSRIFDQPSQGDWASVIHNVQEALAEVARSNNSSVRSCLK